MLKGDGTSSLEPHQVLNDDRLQRMASRLNFAEINDLLAWLAAGQP